MNNVETQVTDQTQPSKKSGLAITALVVGIMSICVGPLGLVAIILGAIGLILIAKSQQRLSGQVMAIVGIVLGVLGLLLMVLAIILLIPALQQAKLAARSITDMAFLQQIRLGMTVYANDNNDLLPAHVGELIVAGHVPVEVFHNPLDPQSQPPVYTPGTAPPQEPYRFGSYVFIPITGTTSNVASPSTTIIAYTAKVDPQQTSRNVLFVDGHVEGMDEQAFRALVGPNVDVDALDGPSP
jgi:prepilin-type processing-associated H-X9-DG protein